MEQYQRNGELFGVLVFDVDSFKLINDDFGHLAGDHALVQVARTLSTVLRSTDVVGRWGGDEFLAIIRHTDGDLLRVLAERCCTLVAKTSVTSGDEAPVFLSISIGGTLASKNDTAEDLIHRADELMYASKATQRGQSRVDS